MDATPVSRFCDIQDARMKDRLFGWMQEDLGVSRYHMLLRYKGKFGSWHSWFKEWSWRKFGYVSLFDNVKTIHLASIVIDDDNWVCIRYKVLTKQNKLHTLVCEYEYKDAPYGFEKAYLPFWEEHLHLDDGERVIFDGEEPLVSGDFADPNNRFQLVKDRTGVS